MEQSPIPFTSGCSTHHSFSYFKLACFWSFNLSFPKKVETPSLSLFLSSLVCIHLEYLRTDISGIDKVSSFHLTHISYHSPLYHSRQFLFYLTCVYEWVVINVFNFFRPYKSPPFHTVIRIHLISLSYHILVILPSHFSSMKQMLMLRHIAIHFQDNYLRTITLSLSLSLTLSVMKW